MGGQFGLFVGRGADEHGTSEVLGFGVLLLQVGLKFVAPLLLFSPLTQVLLASIEPPVRMSCSGGLEYDRFVV